jgi:aryl-alcohol dehydrogenase-like predicted oxidoreductase
VEDRTSRAAPARRPPGYSTAGAAANSAGPHVLAIPGTGDPDHLAATIAAGALTLTPDELARLEMLHQRGL